MDVVRDFVRGAVSVHVLHHAAETAVHGAWLAAELARHGHVISPGTLYPLLHRLEGAGLLASRGRLVDGRARRCYTITPAGRTVLRSLRATVAELADEVLPPDRQATVTPVRRRGAHSSGQGRAGDGQTSSTRRHSRS
jgi:PadR family transcriptional regulator, regulatory protein PadR